MFFGDEGGELDAEVLHVLPPPPLELLPGHRHRCAAATAAVVARAASSTCCGRRSITSPALLRTRAHLHGMHESVVPKNPDLNLSLSP